MVLQKRDVFLLDFILGFLLPAVITFVILFPLFAKPGYILHGDTGWYLYASVPVYLKQMFFTWHEGPLSSNGFFFLAFTLPLLPFGSYFANHAWVFLLAFLPGATSYFSIKKTLNLINGPKNSVLMHISVVIGSVFYLVNWQNYGLDNPTISWAPTYIILPVLTYFLIKIYKERKVQDILIFALVSALGDTVPDWIVFLFVENLFVLIAVLSFNALNIKKISQYLLTTIYLVVATFLANAYMLIEIIGGFIFGAGGVFAFYGSPLSEIVTAENESFYHLIDVLMFGQPNFYSFGLNPINWTPFNVTILMSAIAIFLYTLIGSSGYKKTKLSFTNPLSYSIYFILLIAISLFLAKGFNPPFGFLYKYVILLSPPGIVGITLDIGPWLILAALSYSFLYAIGSYHAFFRLVYEPPSGKEKKEKIKTVKPSNYFNKDYFVKSASFVIIIILLGGATASAISTTDVQLRYFTYPDFSPLYFPEPYIKVTDFIAFTNPNAYVTWLPYNGAYSWENHYAVGNLITNLGGDLSQYFVNPQYLYPYLVNNTINLADLLTVGDIKYLIIDQSGISPVKLSFQQLVNLIEKQKDIKLVYQVSWLMVFENELNFSVVQALDYSHPFVFNNYSIVASSVLNPRVENVKEVSPVQYSFNYYSVNTTLIIFHNVYSNAWVLSVDGNDYKPIPLYSGAEMGFIVQKGFGHATLYYELQNYYYAGAGTTIIFAVISFWYIYRQRKLGKKGGMINQ